MPGSIVIRKPQLRLSDPAESQRPLTFYTQIVLRHWRTIAFVSIALTALVVLACALVPPIHSRPLSTWALRPSRLTGKPRRRP
jgi:hypothetical protein